MIRLFELAGREDDRRFSPYCWRVRLALAFKNLPAETIPWRFTERERIADSGGQRVPVIQDGDRVVADSWHILHYLDRTYPDRPLFGCAQVVAYALFVKHWIEAVIQPLVAPVIMGDLFDRIHPKDRAYFRESREERFGMTLEEFASDPAGARETLGRALAPARLTLADQSFFTGESTGVVDIIAFSAFQWARSVSPRTLVDDDDPIALWCERMLDAFGGVAREGRFG